MIRRIIDFQEMVKKREYRKGENYVTKTGGCDRYFITPSRCLSHIYPILTKVTWLI